MTSLRQWMVSAALGIGMTMSAGNVLAQSQDESGQQQRPENQQARSTQQQPHPELVAQCLDTAKNRPNQEDIQGLAVLETNAGDYKSGHEYPLVVNLQGEGNAIYVVECHVDQQGKPHFEDIKARGQPKK
ncbi:hypothetical protein [Kushneria phosphatilytica]|uniref:Uncharacterized protein n=1 Tax=Kushneria phosphatilytica TaxID=657387 RepID=A0A1S1NQ05_9GAMM|nr:hypothetical protein [Kushneria phosphatilytica]OHV07573.1 hypothetical protein BH688_15265 [Kushneria phosphatilytica]QEL10058.1 hypothetical protein FY550_02205 [Kushneria phosphatilytica]